MPNRSRSSQTTDQKKGGMEVLAVSTILQTGVRKSVGIIDSIPYASFVFYLVLHILFSIDQS